MIEFSNKQRGKIYTKVLDDLIENAEYEVYMCNLIKQRIHREYNLYTDQVREILRSQFTEFMLFNPKENQSIVAPWFKSDVRVNYNQYISREIKDVQELIIMFCIEMSKD